MPRVLPNRQRASPIRSPWPAPFSLSVSSYRRHLILLDDPGFLLGRVDPFAHPGMVEDRLDIGRGKARHGDRVGDKPGDDRREHDVHRAERAERSEEHTSELQSIMRIQFAVFCWK